MALYPSIVHSHWQYMFEETSYSSNEFYSRIETILSERNIPDVKFERVTFSEKKLIGTRREYLRIKWKQYVFDICAAPYGKDFFISWYLGETSGLIKDLIAKIPIVGAWFVKAAELKTYYQMDSEAMFKESIRLCLKRALDDLTTTKGIRKLTEFDLQDKSYSLAK